jgi:catechol 2,3-dioxygenase-like lactoylglutathione lyase family enzyme
MALVPGLKGLRHLALRVKDLNRSKAFYQNVLGMKLVWEPDPHNAYLSSGSDNLALHEVPATSEMIRGNQQLDHFGFVVESIQRLQDLEQDFARRGVTIVHPFKIHRDGSASFYVVDPDGITIQMLFEPTLSRQEIS